MDGNENAVEKRSVESKEETQNETKKTEESLPNKSKQCDTTQSTNTVSGEGKDRSRGFIVPHHPTEDIVVARRSTPWFMAFEKNQDAIEKPINTLSTQSFKDLSKEGTHASCKSADLERINQNGGIIIPNSEHKLEELDLSNPEQQTSNESVENLKTSQNGGQESNNHTSTEIRKPTAWCIPTDQNKSNKNGGAKTIIGIQKPEDTTSNESYNCGQELDEQDQIESDDDEKDLNVILRAYKEAKKLYFAKEQRFMDTFANWNFPTNVASGDDLKNMQNKYDTLMEQYTALQAYNVELEAFAAKSIDHLRLWSRDKENAEMRLLVAEKEITKFYKWRQKMARNKKNRQERLIEKESMKQRIQTIETEKTVDTNADVSKSNVILSKRYQSTPAAFNRLNNFLIPEKEVSAPCTLPMERSNDDKDIGCNTGTESQHCKPTQDKTYDEEQQAYRMDAYNPVEGTLDRTTPSQKEVTQFQVVCHMPTEGEGDVVESRPCFQEHPGESAVVKGEVQASHNKGDIAEKESQIRSPNNDVCDLSRECHLQPTHGVQGSVRIKDGVQISQSDMILMQTRKSGMEKDGACSQTDQEEIPETESRPDVRLDERRNGDFKDGVTDEEGNKPGGLSSGKNISEEDNANGACRRITTAEERLIEDGYDSPFESSDEEDTSDDERKSNVRADDRETIEVKDGSKRTNDEGGSLQNKSQVETLDKEISDKDNADDTCVRITTAEEKLIEDRYDSPFESSDEEETSDDERKSHVQADDRGTVEVKDGSKTTNVEGSFENKSEIETSDKEISEEDNACRRITTAEEKLIENGYDSPFESSDEEETSDDERKSHVQADDRGTVEVKDGSKTTNVEGSFENKSEIETSDKEISEEDNACRRITSAEEKLIEDGYDSPFESSDEEDTSDDESAIGTSEEEDPKSQAQTADEEEEDKAETRVPTGGSQYQYDTFESSDDEESSGDDSLDDSRHVYSSSSSDTIEAAHGHSTSTSSRSSVNSFCSEEKTESSEESHGGSERSFSSGISASSRRSVSVVSYSDTFESYSDESEVSQSDFSQSEVAKSVSQLSAIKNVESEVLQPKPPLNPRTETQYKRPTGFFKGLIPTPPRPSTEPSKFRGGSSTQNSPYTRPTPFISKVPVPARPKTAHPHGTNLLFSQTKSKTCCDDYGAKQLLTQTGSKNRRSDSNLSLAQTESKNCCDDVAVQKTSQAVPRSRLPQLVRSKTPNLSNQKSLPKRPATEPNKYRGKPTRPGSRYSQTKALKPLLQQAQENFAKRSSSECKMLKTGKLPKLNSKAIGTPVKKKLTKKHPKESAVKVPNIRNEKPSKKDTGKSGKSPSRLPQRVGVKKLITPTFEPDFHKLLPKIKVTLVEKSRPSKNDFISRKPGSMSMIPIPKNSPRKPRGESKRNQ